MSTIIEVTPHFYTFQPWHIADIVAGFTDRTCDFSTGVFQDHHHAFLATMGIVPESIMLPHQVHGSTVSFVNQDMRGYALECDGIITNVNRMALAIRTADCVPLFFFVPIVHLIGLAHVGWQGLRQGIVTRMVQAITERYGDVISQVEIGIGPCIRRCCYEIQMERARFFSRGVHKKKGRIFLDLVEIIMAQLIAGGVSKDSIMDCHVCTACNNDRFFSYRKEGERAGRQLAIMMLK